MLIYTFKILKRVLLNLMDHDPLNSEKIPRVLVLKEYLSTSNNFDPPYVTLSLSFYHVDTHWQNISLG
jgi:hypothetical protein